VQSPGVCGPRSACSRRREGSPGASEIYADGWFAVARTVPFASSPPTPAQFETFDLTLDRAVQHRMCITSAGRSGFEDVAEHLQAINQALCQLYWKVARKELTGYMFISQ